jgi:hypothetical protein
MYENRTMKLVDIILSGGGEMRENHGRGKSNFRSSEFN